MMEDVDERSPQARSSLGGESSSTFTAHSSNAHPTSIDTEKWGVVEQAAEGIILQIHPTAVADRRRREVVEFVRSLIKGVADAEIFPFGSVPLKTYLPDGDIDLTAIESPRLEDGLASDVLAVLQAEEQNKNSEFEVRDVQYIHAEVKLVKCLVQNIVVDISFQQVGGLCTLCFLEKVDRVIGKNHLFKRSIILIKAWCYYESRILGAHHGLISTYALETMVLYIFHVFHSSLEGPLAVLYRFLDYFSKFNWDRYCLSLNGPVLLSSLPEIVAIPLQTDGGDLLLSKDFLTSCEDTFASTFKWSDNDSSPRLFHQKYLNIIDPLKANNNLGRSVSKGNFYRIRSAFTYGARKLGRILILPRERIPAELNKFFMNTLERHDNGERSGGLDGELIPSLTKVDIGDNVATSSTSIPGDFCERLFEDVDNIRTSGLVAEPLGQAESCNCLAESYPCRSTNADINGLAEGIATSYLYQAGCGKIQRGRTDPRNKGNASQSSPSPIEIGIQNNHASLLLCGKEDGNLMHDSERDTNRIRGNSPLRKMSASSEDTREADATESEIGIGNCAPESPGLSDLTGDYCTHMENLLYAMDCLEKQPTILLCNQKLLNSFPQINANGIIRGSFSPGYCPTYIPGTFSLEDLPKTRGTGTYFPNVNHGTYMERRSPRRGGNPSPVGLFARPRNNCQPLAPADKTQGERGTREPLTQVLVDLKGSPNWRCGQSESSQNSCATPRGPLPVRDLSFIPENGLEFGTYVAAKSTGSPWEPSKDPEPHIPPFQTSEVPELSTVKKTAASTMGERPRRSYQLKDDDDFPPLR